MLTAVCLMGYYSSMPVILGRAAESRGLVEQELGFLGGAFAGGVTVTSFLCIWFIRKVSWRLLVMFGGVMASASFVMPVFISGFYPLIVCHISAGIFCGLGYSVAIACLGDTANPTRNYAFCFVIQTLVGMNVSYFLPRLTAAETGFDVALCLLAGLALASVFIGMLLPTKGRQRDTAHQMTTASIPVYVLLSLLVILLIYAGDGAVWAFVERIAINNGLTVEIASVAVGGSLFAGAVGSLMAGIIGTRFGYLMPMLMSVVVSIASVIVLQFYTDPMSFTLAIILNGWAWNFGSGYRMGLVAELDTSGRFTPLITGMQLLGSTVGTLLAGLLVVNGSFHWVFVFASVLWTTALLLFVWVLHHAKREPTVVNPQ